MQINAKIKVFSVQEGKYINEDKKTFKTLTEMLEIDSYLKDLKELGFIEVFPFVFYCPKLQLSLNVSFSVRRG
jgi:predicted transcriptional regulator